MTDVSIIEELQNSIRDRCKDVEAEIKKPFRERADAHVLGLENDVAIMYTQACILELLKEITKKPA